MSIYFSVGGCSLGKVLVAQSAFGVCAILMGDDETLLMNELKAICTRETLLENHELLKPHLGQVSHFIDSPMDKIAFPLDIQGTLFQLSVWQALRDIPFGETLSYRDMARKIHRPDAVRAVANACASNHLAVVIPCHRVIRTDGTLSGYRWGIDRKRQLLENEARCLYDM